MINKMTTKEINIDALMTATGVRFGTSGIRGLVESMSDEVCYAYTAAFLKSVVGSAGALAKVVLGHDLRPSSPKIAAACAAAVKDAGMQLIYVGALPTPALADYANYLGATAIVVTGSHIPFDRNGIKFYTNNGEISKSEESLIQSSVIDVPTPLPSMRLPEADVAATAHYVKRYVDFFGKDSLKGLRVAIYEHSSVARDVLHDILESLGVEVIKLGRTEDFVPIDTEAVRAEDIVQGGAWAKEYKFDAIFSTDGDADRPLMGDEFGQWFRGDVVGILCAKFLNADVVITPVSSNTLAEKTGWFSKVVRTRIGSPYVISAMEREIADSSNIVAGFEANGGFLLGTDIKRDGRVLNALPTRDAVLPMLALVGLSRDMGCKVSELLKILPSRFTASNRLQNFSNEQSRVLLDSLNQNHQQAAHVMAPRSGDVVSIDLTDGLRVSFNNGDIVHLRPSGNAPELRCYAESDTQLKAQLLCDSCLENIMIV